MLPNDENKNSERNHSLSLRQTKNNKNMESIILQSTNTTGL